MIHLWRVCPKMDTIYLPIYMLFWSHVMSINFIINKILKYAGYSSDCSFDHHEPIYISCIIAFVNLDIFNSKMLSISKCSVYYDTSDGNMLRTHTCCCRLYFQLLNKASGTILYFSILACYIRMEVIEVKDTRYNR